MNVDHCPSVRNIHVLVFDCWLPGFLYIKDLVGMEGVTLTYVHNSESQMGQPAKEYEDFKTRLETPIWVKDFSEFDKDFSRLFEVINPDVLLVTSMHYVEHRSALLFAKEYGVLRAFIPHGIFKLNGTNESVSSDSKGTRFENILNKVPRVLYYTNLFWSSHFQRTLSKRGTLYSAFTCFRDLLLYYPSWQWRPAAKVQKYYADLVDVALVYDLSLKDFYLENSRDFFVKTDFIMCGTLDSGKLLREIKAKPSLLQASRNSTPSAYFVSSPYPEFFSEHGASVLAGLLKSLKSLVVSAGCHQLVYRAHPGEPGWFVDKVCTLAELVRDTEPGTEGLIRATLICGTSSSLLYSATLLGKPIVIVASRRIRFDLPYYEPLISYPKITIDLDSDLEVLIREHCTAISASMTPKDDMVEILATDPLESLLEYSENFQASSL
jgi:hypothetical protein